MSTSPSSSPTASPTELAVADDRRGSEGQAPGVKPRTGTPLSNPADGACPVETSGGTPGGVGSSRESITTTQARGWMPHGPFYIHHPCEPQESGRLLLLGLGADEWDDTKPRVRVAVSVWQDTSFEFAEYRSLDLLDRGAVLFESTINTSHVRGDRPFDEHYKQIVVRGDTQAYLQEGYTDCEDIEHREIWQVCSNRNVREVIWSIDLNTGGQIIYNSLSNPTIHELAEILDAIDRLIEIE